MNQYWKNCMYTCRYVCRSKYLSGRSTVKLNHYYSTKNVTPKICIFGSGPAGYYTAMQVSKVTNLNHLYLFTINYLLSLFTIYLFTVNYLLYLFTIYVFAILYCYYIINYL